MAANSSASSSFSFSSPSPPPVPLAIVSPGRIVISSSSDDFIDWEALEREAREEEMEEYRKREEEEEVTSQLRIIVEDGSEAGSLSRVAVTPLAGSGRQTIEEEAAAPPSPPVAGPSSSAAPVLHRGRRPIPGVISFQSPWMRGIREQRSAPSSPSSSSGGTPLTSISSVQHPGWKPIPGTLLFRADPNSSTRGRRKKTAGRKKKV